MVDLRPSLCASGREQEALTLLAQCMAGEGLSPREARRLLPAREQCVAAWRALEKLLSAGSVTAGYLRRWGG